MNVPMDATSAALKWHTVAEASQLTGISRRTLWRKVGAGELPSRLEGGRRLVGLAPSDMSATSTGLASAAVAAAGAFRAADGMVEAVRAVEASAALAVAQAKSRADEAAGRIRQVEASLARWRVAAVIVPVGVAVALLAWRPPSSARADGIEPSQVAQAAEVEVEVERAVPPMPAPWHPPMALPEPIR
jgi:predicted DNA-binding transcriptional regulator AlpA